MYNMILVSGVLHNDFGPLLLLSVSYLFSQSFHLHLSLVGLLRIASDLFSSSLLVSSVDLSVEFSILITIAFHPINTFWFIFKAHPVTYFNSIFPLYRVLTPLFVDDPKCNHFATCICAFCHLQFLGVWVSSLVLACSAGLDDTSLWVELQPQSMCSPDWSSLRNPPQECSRPRAASFLFLSNGLLDSQCTGVGLWLCMFMHTF